MVVTSIVSQNWGRGLDCSFLAREVLRGARLCLHCDWTKSHSNSVNAMGFRVLFLCLIVVNGRQLFAC